MDDFVVFHVFKLHKRGIALCGVICMPIKKFEKDKPDNSSMAKDMKETKELGKIMEHIETNEKVEENGKEPDPKQHK